MKYSILDREFGPYHPAVLSKNDFWFQLLEIENLLEFDLISLQIKHPFNLFVIV